MTKSIWWPQSGKRTRVSWNEVIEQRDYISVCLVSHYNPYIRRLKAEVVKRE